MSPEWYINLRITAAIAPVGQGLASMAGPGALANAVMGRLLHVVHAICARQGMAFASAFPLAQEGNHPHPGNLLRVFVASRDHADCMLEALEQQEFLLGHVLLDRPRKVPPGVDSSVSYQLFRISSAKNLNQITRRRQIECSDTKPYVRMTSRSGERFSLRFSITARDVVADVQGQANGYGLSLRTRPFFLPAVPVEPEPWSASARQQWAAVE